MQTRFSLALAGLVLSVSLSLSTRAQEQIQSDGVSLGNVRHSLFGDVKVAGMEASAGTTTLNVILYEAAGRQLGRVPIPPNGRFRFNDVPNGEFILTVEVENSEVYREQFIVYEGRSTDLRKDIELMWQATEPAAGGTVFARTVENRRQFEDAQKALAAGDLKRAVNLLQRVVDSDRGDYEAWTELGTAEFQREKYSESERAYQQALALKSDYLPALLNLGKLQFNRKQFEAAIVSLEQAVAVAPNNAEANHLLGESFLGVRKGSRAVGYLEAAIRLDPAGKAEIHLRLAQLYDAAGMKSRAANEYRAFLEKRPDSPRRKELERYIEANP